MYRLSYSLVFLIGISLSAISQRADQCLEISQTISLKDCQFDFEDSEGFDFHDEAMFQLMSQHFSKEKRKGKTNYFRDAGTAVIDGNQTVTIFDVHNYFQEEEQLERLQINRTNAFIDPETKSAVIEYKISFIVDGRQGENCARLKNKFDGKYRIFQHESIIRESIIPFMETFMSKAEIKTKRYLRCN